MRWGGDERRIIGGRMHDAPRCLTDPNDVLGNTGYRFCGKKEVPVAESEEAARSNFQHSDLPFILIDEEIAHMADVCTEPVDDFTTSNILTRVREDKARIT
jgi:hypothetical protein